mmetsp:Transcript_69545/g.96699  ORF Transcript_69545/g.96699 Transcript_69545/m.96699 type:complete len:520 (+) Transcript_69545:84-1643(+)
MSKKNKGGGDGPGSPLARSPNPDVELSSASIASHETVTESSRFTVFNIEINTKDGKFFVPRRYSEFRDLYDSLNKAFPSVKFSFPKKKMLGSNFDKSFLASRQKGLEEFIQKVFESPEIAQHPAVRSFFFDAPRHGRGAQPIPSDEPIEPDTSESDGSTSIPFDLGKGADTKASVKDFEMLKVIGKGSFGRVLLGKHNKTGTCYAIKVLSKEAIVRQNEVGHIMSERAVLQENVRHPFLVGLHYSFQTPQKLYFVLDYVNGGELFFHLQQEKRFSIARARFYAAEITSALGFLHALDVVYRDLKPENILLDSDGHVVLTDFGLCKENVKPGGGTATFCGTPEYLAPEVLKKHSYGRPVDWWCLGCVTFEMMCGLPPFYSRDCNEMYDRILHDSISFPDFVPGPARSFLRGLLVRIPDQRLGGSIKDAKDVMKHEFFDGIDWAALDRREVEPPFKPGVRDDFDLSNIDPQFTAEPVPMSVMPETAVSAVSVTVGDKAGFDSAFDGFSFQGSGAIGKAAKS